MCSGAWEPGQLIGSAQCITVPGSQACYLLVEGEPRIRFPLHKQYGTMGCDAESPVMSLTGNVTWYEALLSGSRVRSFHDFILTSVSLISGPICSCLVGRVKLEFPDFYLIYPSHYYAYVMRHIFIFFICSLIFFVSSHAEIFSCLNCFCCLIVTVLYSEAGWPVFGFICL